MDRDLDIYRALKPPSLVVRCLYDLGLLDKAGTRTSAGARQIPGSARVGGGGRGRDSFGRYRRRRGGLPAA